MIAKCHAPATLRNREPIAAALQRVLPDAGLVLEVASGTGEHAAFFAGRFPHLDWQPTDCGDLGSIAAWRAESACPNLRAPMHLDVTDWPWPIVHADAVFCANMTHIAPWAATEGLMHGVGRILRAGGPFLLYGPFCIGGEHVSDSNARFDASLRAQDPNWGVRDLEAVVNTAAAHGLRHVETVDMPANNKSVIFVKDGP